jgi:flagellar hook-associated protein 3 FlgL
MPSSDFRITPRMTSRLAMSNLQNNIEKLNKIQSQISSMKLIQKPSDSPVGMVSAMHYRSDMGRNDQVSRNINDGLSWLNLAGDTLGSVFTQLQKVRDLTIQGANATADATAREAIATEIDNIKSTIVGLANTKNLDRPIFAGTATGNIAYDAAGNYVGKTAVIERSIAPGVRMQVTVNGDEVFGPAGNDVFTMLTKLAADMRTNPSQLSTDTASLDSRISGVQNSIASIGARSNRLETMKDRNSMDGLTLKQSLSQVEDVDLAQATMELSLQQVAYQAALQTTAKVIQPSLVDFLK